MCNYVPTPVWKTKPTNSHCKIDREKLGFFVITVREGKICLNPLTKLLSVCFLSDGLFLVPCSLSDKMYGWSTPVGFFILRYFLFYLFVLFYSFHVEVWDLIYRWNMASDSKVIIYIFIRFVGTCEGLSYFQNSWKTHSVFHRHVWENSDRNVRKKSCLFCKWRTEAFLLCCFGHRFS